MKHWIFDLDGTLVNSFPCYTKVVVEVIQDFGIRLSEDDQEQIKHHYPKRFLAQFLKPEQIDPAFDKVVATSLQRLGEVPIYEGVYDLLNFLRSKNCLLSVFTARERITALGILEATRLRQHFSHIVTRDCVINCKPSPDGIHRILNESKSLAEQAVMIGDHLMDMESAKSAGVKRISVNWDGSVSHAHVLSDLHFTCIRELHSWAALQVGTD